MRFWERSNFRNSQINFDSLLCLAVPLAALNETVAEEETDSDDSGSSKLVIDLDRSPEHAEPQEENNIAVERTVKHLERQYQQ